MVSSVPEQDLLYAMGRNLKTPGENRSIMMPSSIMNGISTIRAMVFAWLAWLLVSLWSRTMNIRIVNRDIAERLAAQGKRFCAWRHPRMEGHQIHEDRFPAACCRKRQ